MEPSSPVSEAAQGFAALAQSIADIDGATIDRDLTFDQLTTLHLGGAPAGAVRCAKRQAAVEVVTLLDAHSVPLLIVGGGSNLVIADGAVPLVAVVLEFDGVSVPADGSGVLVAEAGARWDDVVARAVELGLGGIECLSGIPGSAGATPVQNVGAYGVEIADVLRRVQLLDRSTGEVTWVPASALDLAYRYSNLKFTSRGVVLAVELELTGDGMSAPLRFGQLARRLGVSEEERSPRRPVAEVREAVLELRRGKGMVYGPSDRDTWSAGSFFTNPIVPAAQAAEVRELVAERLGAEAAEGMPCFSAGAEGEDLRKLSAAWLIDHAGLKKGYPGDGAPARLSTKHTLALTNRGRATTADLVALAREVRAEVRAAFGVTLEPEPVWIGVSISE